MTELTLHFEDYDQTGYLIRFGHKEHLEQILNGKIRFTNLKKYQRDENKNIGDVNEGVRTFLHQNGELKITFSHPLLEHGKEIDISKSITSFKDYPDNKKYVSCFSYFTMKDILEKTIVTEQVLAEKEWNSVLILINSDAFIKAVLETLRSYNANFRKVQYLDYSINQTNLNEFTKSQEYSHQKEIRFSIEYNGEQSSVINVINSDVLEIDLNQTFKGIIIPTADLSKCFTITNKES
ncbi:MAG: hypothetical protein SPJ93_00200 [Treponema sp.]|nr:hypothetical protein [Treponema sp.]